MEAWGFRPRGDQALPPPAAAPEASAGNIDETPFSWACDSGLALRRNMEKSTAELEALRHMAALAPQKGSSALLASAKERIVATILRVLEA